MGTVGHDGDPAVPGNADDAVPVGDDCDDGDDDAGDVGNVAVVDVVADSHEIVGKVDGTAAQVVAAEMAAQMNTAGSTDHGTLDVDDGLEWDAKIGRAHV